MKKIILITGGERSGKSSYAEQTALALSPNPVYLATARVWDDEFRERVRQHQLRRGPEWTNIEEELELGRHDVNGQVVLIDCITLWCTNFFYRNRQRAEDDSTWVNQCLEDIKAEFDRFTAQDATFIFVTNEIGMGGVSANALQRRFTDLQGWVNQYVASRANEVMLMVSGIPVKIKRT
jgi:adenosylcobinamide kinase/adenosylcobinamide-phosphate guanylyltransferase